MADGRYPDFNVISDFPDECESGVMMCAGTVSIVKVKFEVWQEILFEEREIDGRSLPL